jgi:hypothetical protein
LFFRGFTIIYLLIYPFNCKVHTLTYLTNKLQDDKKRPKRSLCEAFDPDLLSRAHALI